MRPASTPFTRNEQSLVIRLLRCANTCFARIFHQVDVQTPCLLPRHGPAILVCNHVSGLDPVLIQSACPRLIRWMMAREYFNFICTLVGAIPVDRSGRDMAATRAALDALKAGYVLGVFPEGKIETTHDLLPFQNGIALLAAKSNAPIYPAYLEGSQRGKPMLQAYFQPQRSILRFGQPFSLDRAQTHRLGFDHAANQVRNAVEILRKTRLIQQHINIPSLPLPHTLVNSD